MAERLRHTSAVPAVVKAINTAHKLSNRSVIAAEWQHINDAADLTPIQKSDARKTALVKHAKLANDFDAEIVEAFATVEKMRPPISDTKHGAELRAYFRTVPEDQRGKALRDPEIAEAVAAAPRALSGLPEQAYDDLKNEVRTRLYPAAMESISADLAALSAARDAQAAYLETARTTFRPKAVTSVHQIPTPAAPPNPFTT